MTDREAMKLALDALELYQSEMSVQMFDVAITALRQALEQPDPVEAAVLAEREACAKLCDEMDHDGVMVAADCAAMIRERMK